MLLPGDAVPGGFYMGDDYVKYTTPMATSLSLLAWGMVEFKGGYKDQVPPHASWSMLLLGTVQFLGCQLARQPQPCMCGPVCLSFNCCQV